MPLDFQVTKTSVVNGRRKVVKHQPYMRLSKDHQHVYIQNGQVFAGGGERMNTLPDWFEEEMKKQGKESLDAVGWEEHRQVGRPLSKEKLEAKLEQQDKTLHLKKETSKDA